MPPARRSTPAAGPAESDPQAAPGDDEDTPDLEGSPDAGASPGPKAGSRQRAAVVTVLGAATIALGGLGIWAIVTAHGLRAAAADANVALVDRTTTRTVNRDITRTVETIFSYNYGDTSRTRASAQRLLTGAAIRQYDQLFALVEQQAPKQKLVVTTKVTSIGVELLTGGRARVLVFANQQDTRAGTGQTSYGGAMFAVTAVNLHGRWKIANIDTFTGGA